MIVVYVDKGKEKQHLKANHYEIDKPEGYLRVYERDYSPRVNEYYSSKYGSVVKDKLVAVYRYWESVEVVD